MFILVAPAYAGTYSCECGSLVCTIRDFGKKALFAPSVVGKCSFIIHKLRFAAELGIKIYLLHAVSALCKALTLTNHINI